MASLAHAPSLPRAGLTGGAALTGGSPSLKDLSWPAYCVQNDILTGTLRLRHHLRLLKARVCICLSAIATATTMPVPLTAGEMVLSQFVFRDIDRDGVYELGEPPISGVPVRLTRPGAEPVIVETNLAGFANFLMSPGRGHISGPGEISIEVLLPTELMYPVDPIPYSTQILALPAAPGGLVAEETPPFVGLAPRLGLSIAADANDEVTCTSQEGIEWQAIEASDGRHCPVSPGRWTVRWRNRAEIKKVQVEVDHWPLRVPKPIEDAIPSGEPLTIIDFDDLITSNTLVEVPTGVADMHWQNFVATHRMYYEGAGYINGTTSGEFAAYTSSGHTARMWSDSPFDLVSVNLTIAWPAGLDAQIVVEAFRNGVLVSEDRFRGSHISPKRFAPNWSGITELRIWHESYWQVVIDDLTLK